MGHQCYYVRERSRVTGPFDLAQLQEMRRRNQLARFHMVSSDRLTWVSAETLAEVFHPVSTPPPDPAASSKAGSPLSRTWFYTLGNQVHGPLETPVLQELIDRGVVGPDVLVRPEGSTQWSICRQAGGFRFDPLPSALSDGPSPRPTPSPGRRLGSPKAWLVGSAVALSMTLMVGLSMTLWSITQSDRRDTRTDLLARDASEAPAQPAAPNVSIPKSPQSRPELAKQTPKPVAKAEPEPEPDPASAPVREVRSAYVKLPEASGSASQHDGTVHALDVPLPSAGRFALRLRGLDDPEVRDCRLVARPREPGRADTLIVFRDPVKGGGKAQMGVEPQELARFWIAESRLLFRWAPRIVESLKKPSRVLRDCILEVRGGGVRLNLALRGPVADLRALMVTKGQSKIDWRREPPVRKLFILACQVKPRGGDWREVPEKAAPNRRRLIVTTAAAKDGDSSSQPPPLVFSVTLMGDDLALRAELTPSVRTIDQKLRDLQSLEKKLQEWGLSIKQKSSLAEQTLRQQPRSPAQAGSAASPGGPGTTNPGTAPGATGSKNEVADERSLQFAQMLAGLSELDRSWIRVREQWTRVREERMVWKQMRTDAENYRSAPIRVRLGMVVDGDQLEVARIGPE